VNGYRRLTREQVEAHLDALHAQEASILGDLEEVQDKIEAINDQLRSQRSGSRSWRSSATSARDHTIRERDNLWVELTAVRASITQATKALDLSECPADDGLTQELRLIRLMVGLIPESSDHHTRVRELALIFLAQKGVPHDHRTSQSA
jgi:hypothetical protein